MIHSRRTGWKGRSPHSTEALWLDLSIAEIPFASIRARCLCAGCRGRTFQGERNTVNLTKKHPFHRRSHYVRQHNRTASRPLMKSRSDSKQTAGNTSSLVREVSSWKLLTNRVQKKGKNQSLWPDAQPDDLKCWNANSRAEARGKYVGSFLCHLASTGSQT